MTTRIILNGLAGEYGLLRDAASREYAATPMAQHAVNWVIRTVQDGNTAHLFWAPAQSEYTPTIWLITDFNKVYFGSIVLEETE